MKYRELIGGTKNDEGIGMVSAMLVLSLLAVFALVAAQLATNERRTAFNEYVHVGSFMSADSGGEAAIGWLRGFNGAPAIPNLPVDSLVTTRGETNIRGSQRYNYRIDFRQLRSRAGDDIENFADHWYTIDTQGGAGPNGNSNVELVVSKRVKHGY